MPLSYLFSRVDVNSLKAIEGFAKTLTPAVMVNGTTVFRISGGPINLIQLFSLCVTANDTTASTLQWSADPDTGAAATFSAATATLASAAAGALVVTDLTALTTAPRLVATGVALAAATPAGIILTPGIITQVIGVGSTTGTWQHFLRYKPLGEAVQVTPSF